MIEKSTTVTILKFDGTNYSIWRRRMTMALGVKRLSDTISLKGQATEKNLKRAAGMIRLSLSNEILVIIPEKMLSLDILHKLDD
jgi:gag-polypeptide of LTR copia-type